MSTKSVKPLIVVKLLVAAVLITALVTVAAHEIFPVISVPELLLFCLGGMCFVFALMVGGSICSLQFSQLILRIGGTDTQWFWFATEPRGLVQQREALASLKPVIDKS